MNYLVALVVAGLLPQANPEIALLVGVRGTSGYRTLYFTGSQDSVRLSGFWPFIVVPSDSGLCAVQITQLPGARYRYAAVGLACNTLMEEPAAPDLYEDAGCDGFAELKLLFASRRYLAFERLAEAVCANVSASERLLVARFADFTNRWLLADDIRGVGPTDVFGSRALETFRSAALQACREYLRSPRARDRDFAIEGMPECTEALVDDRFDNWAIRQRLDGAEVVGRIAAWRLNYLDFPVRLPVPGTTERQIPGRMKATLQRVMRLTVAPDEEIVMLEWTTGSGARELAGMVTQLRERH